MARTSPAMTNFDIPHAKIPANHAGSSPAKPLELC
jgi:hypothetical protein